MSLNSLSKSDLIKEAQDLGLDVNPKSSKAEIISLIEQSQAQELQSAVEVADSTDSVDSVSGQEALESVADSDTVVDNTDDSGQLTKSLEEIIAERKAESDAMYERKAQAEVINAKLEDIAKEGTTAPADIFQKVQQSEAEKAAVAKRIADIIAARKDLKTPKNTIEDIIRDRKIKAGVVTATLEEVLAERRKKIR